VVFAGCCLFVGKLPLSESCVRELPFCLHSAIVNTHQRGVHRVLLVGTLPLSESCVRELHLCLHHIIMDTRQCGVCWVLFVCREVTFVRELRQGVTFVFAGCHCGIVFAG
jgi:hypothetical protein